MNLAVEHPLATLPPPLRVDATAHQLCPSSISSSWILVDRACEGRMARDGESVRAHCPLASSFSLIFIEHLDKRRRALSTIEGVIQASIVSRAV